MRQAHLDRWPAAALALIVAALTGAGCRAAPADTPLPTATPGAPQAAAPLPTLAEEATVAEANAEEATNAGRTPADAGQSETAIPGRPSAPAGINDDFRSDPASVVGATGRPQLLEFFTYW